MKGSQVGNTGERQEDPNQMVHRNRHALILGGGISEALSFSEPSMSVPGLLGLCGGQRREASGATRAFSRLGGRMGGSERAMRGRRGCDDFSIIDRQRDVLFAGNRRGQG
jgi:hypothetical protein